MGPKPLWRAVAKRRGFDVSERKSVTVKRVAWHVPREGRKLPKPVLTHKTGRDLGWDWGRDPFDQNFRKFRSNTKWIGSVQSEKFRKNWPSFWGGPLFPLGPVGILVEWIAPREKQRKEKCSETSPGVSCRRKVDSRKKKKTVFKISELLGTWPDRGELTQPKRQRLFPFRKRLLPFLKTTEMETSQKKKKKWIAP